jgi:adenosylhomocysteine nucleosidase
MLVVESGIGLVRAQRALEWVLAEKGRPSFLVMAGYAGGLQDHLRLGEVVVAQEIVDHEGHRWPTTWPPASLAPDLPRVRLLTSPTLLGDPQEKRRLGQLHQAQIVDMEAAAVARFCTEHGISFACVRALSDDVNTALSPELVTLLAAGQVSIPQVLKALLLRPRLLGELINLGRHTRLASEKLAEGLQRLLR